MLLPVLCRLLAMLTLGWAASPAHGQPAPAPEYQAKAAFLYNFTKFVEWPARAFAGAASPINLCVVGEDPFGAALDAIQERQAQGRPLAVKRLHALPQAGTCHLLYFCPSEERHVRQWLAALKGQPLLTVGEVERFAENGGVINLVIEDRRVKMDVNVDAAQRQGLKISSQLLRLARIVSEEP